MPQFRIVDDEPLEPSNTQDDGADLELPPEVELQPDVSIEWIRSLVKEDNSVTKLKIVTPLFGVN